MTQKVTTLTQLYKTHHVCSICHSILYTYCHCTLLILQINCIIYIEDQNPNHFVVGAFSDEKLIGISAFSRFDTSKFQHRGILFQVFVNPKFQGLKIGENLVRQTLTSAFALSGLEQIELGVIETNHSAEKLYQKLGFEKFGTQVNYLKIKEKYLHQNQYVLFKNKWWNSVDN